MPVHYNTDLFISMDELRREGLLSHYQVMENMGTNSYGGPLALAAVNDAVCTKYGAYLPSVNKFIVETSLVAGLQHKPDVDNFLKAPGLTPKLPAADLSWDGKRAEPWRDEIFWANFPWDYNYQHFVVETLPRIYLAQKHLPRLTPLSVFLNDRDFVSEYAELCGVAKKHQITGRLDQTTDTVLGRVKRLYFSSVINVNMWKINNQVLKLAVQNMRRKTIGPISSPPAPKKFYMGRKPGPDDHGASRVLQNEQPLSKHLVERGYTPIYMEDESIASRIVKLDAAQVVISPVGAGLTNLIFAPRLKELVVLQHPNVNLPTKWFADLINQFANCKVSDVEGVAKGDNPKDRHAPYVVGIKKVLKVVGEEV